MAGFTEDFFFGSGVNTFKMIQKEGNEDWIDDTLLSSIFPAENELLDEIVENFNLDGCSDTGLLYGQVFPASQPIGFEVDLCLNDALIETNSLIQDIEDEKLSEDNVNSVTDDSCEQSSVDSIDYVKVEEVECEEVTEPLYLMDPESSDTGHESSIILDMNLSDDDSNDANSEHFSSANSLSDSGEGPPEFVKWPTPRTKRFKSSNYSNANRLQNKRKVLEKLEENMSDDSDVIYPRLILTPEEQKLVKKENIRLPVHYPLTKGEERELKRIRRKIRNKISAQDSRRRRKEYVDGLELRVKRTSEENANLMKRIKTLETQKMTLVTQVKNLQASLARCSGHTAPSSTCLLVFVMSLALILAPNLRNSPVSSDNRDDEGISLSEGQSASSSPSRSSRNLLFAQKSHEEQTDLSEEAKMLTETLEKMQVPDLHVLAGLMDTLKFDKDKTELLLKDHDYFRPRKRLASEALEEESWLPPNILTGMRNIASSFLMAKGEPKGEEPDVIDLLSD